MYPPYILYDRILLEIRKFIAATIFFNAQNAEKAGLGLTDMQMLHMLQLYGPSTPGRLAKWTGLSTGGVTVALDRLEKAGYIRREDNPDDRRSLLVTLMPARLRKLAGLYEGVERETRRLLATLPEGDLEAVVRFFETRLAATEVDGNARVVEPSDMIRTLETQRLLLRPLEIADAEQAQQLFPQWEVVRYLNSRVPWPYPSDGVLSNYRDVVLPAMERGEEWHWSLRLRDFPEQMIGSISLRTREGHNRGFWLGLPWHGQGLMAEACEVVTDYWFDELKFPILRVPKAVANSASRRISEKMGMRIVETSETDYVSGRLLTEVWEITAEEWHAWKQRNRRKAQTTEPT